MTALNKDALKALFETGDTITQTTMANLIDSFVDTVETSAQNIAGPIVFSSPVTLNGGISVSAPFTVPNGGTGLTSISAYAVMVGSNTSAISTIPPSSASGVPLISQGISANPTFGTAAVVGGGTGQVSYIDGQLLIGNSSGNTLTKATLTQGTNITITNGNGSITIAASTGGASGVLLQTQSASNSASIAFSATYITSTYKKYTIELINVIPSTDGANLTLVVSTDNGSSYKTAGSDYVQSGFRITSQGTLGGVAVGSAASIGISNTNGVTSGTGGGLSSNIAMYNPNSSAYKQFVISSTFPTSTTNCQLNITEGTYVGSVTAINNIKFAFDAGNIASGTFNIYGIS